MSKYAFTIEPGVHAKLSASSADRWTNCSGSVVLSAGLPNVSSKYAAEGTAAHYIAAECQRFTVFAGSYIGKVALVEGHEIPLTEELVDSVIEFLAYIRENELPDDKWMVEQTFTPAMRKLDDEFGGSCDRVMWRESEKLLRVYDYKHGAGVPVDVDDNKQLKYYALGALLTNPQYNAEIVELVIAQPRCDHYAGRIRSFFMPAFELVDYAADLIAAAKRTRVFGAELNPGKKQCKFCPAQAANKCPAIVEETHELVSASFSMAPIANYSAEQIADFLAKAPLVEARISAIREFAYQAACRGEEIPGFKLVDKRATRRWKDEEAASKHVGESRAYYTAPELKSPAQVEKLIGRKAFKELEQFIEKRSSGVTLAPDTDPRPPAQQALLEDFNVVTSTTETGE